MPRKCLRSFRKGCTDKFSFQLWKVPLCEYFNQNVCVGYMSEDMGVDKHVYLAGKLRRGPPAGKASS